MCPENAKVFIAEDRKKWREKFKNAMNQAGHEVVKEVDSLEQGLSAIPDLKKDGANVALVDASISNNRRDGITLTTALKKAIPDIKVVDVSTFGDVKNADVKMIKDDFNAKKLGELVRDLYGL